MCNAPPAARPTQDNCGGPVFGPVSSARPVRWWLQRLAIRPRVVPLVGSAGARLSVGAVVGRDCCGGNVYCPAVPPRHATTQDDRVGQPGGARHDGLVSITRCGWSAFVGARFAADATACRGLCAAAAGRLQRSALALRLATKQHWRLLVAAVGARLATGVGD